jgi:hypothetical protein
LARFILVSGALRSDEVGLFLQPDNLWARTFGAKEGWYVARWPEIAAIDLRKGGRYSMRRARLRVFDASGRELFRGEVTRRSAIEMLARTDLVERREPSLFEHRRYERVGGGASAR